eukprot:NODE_614_length_5380_cov_0.964022.p4 type:complete len:304 gc:universal NODE_614_length_5380_cov_0.964022:2956-2045(-)
MILILLIFGTLNILHERVDTSANRIKFTRIYHDDSRNVVIKEKCTPTDQSEKLKERLQQELELLSKLDHPHIIKILTDVKEVSIPNYLQIYKSDIDVKIDEPLTYTCFSYEMPYYKMDLAQYIHPMDKNDSLNFINTMKNVARQLLTAVSILHSQGIFHRDIKPNNILVDASTQPFTFILNDFGFATTQVTSRKLAGTSYFLPPEILNPYLHGQKIPAYNCEEMDIFQIGATIGYMYLDYAKIPKSNFYNDLNQFDKPKDDWVQLFEFVNYLCNDRPAAIDAMKHPFVKERFLETILKFLYLV